MANFQQSNAFGQYSGYGSGIQYDGSQTKWGQGTGTNTGNQMQTQSQQNQQQLYQATAQAAQNYAAASGFYGNQTYGQQQSYSTVTADTGSSMNMIGNRNTNNSVNTSTNKSANSFGNTAGSVSNYGSAVGSTNYTNPATSGSTQNYTGGGNFGTNTSNNTAGVSAASQMFGTAYANPGQNSGMSSNTASNTSGTFSTGQTQGFGSNATLGLSTTTSSNALGQQNQTSQMFGNGANFGNYTSGDAAGGNVGTGYNAFNTGMMTLLQQTLMQQASGGAGYGTGNAWGMPDGSGGYYAAPVDSNFQFGGAGDSQGKKGRKWSGKDGKQDFYGNRFAQMFTGAPGIMGQSQGSGSGAGKQKRLMDGVRFNVKGEKVVDVEVPLTLYSRWGQLRKFFSKQDTEVVKHLLEFHDEMCDDCLEREECMKKKRVQLDEPEAVEVAASGVEAEETEVTEEDMALRQIMGFGSFNTTREAMTEGNQVNYVASADAAKPCNSDKLPTSTSWEAKAGFIGPTKPVEEPLVSQSKDPKNEEQKLSEEEKNMMEKLGWSVFNRKKNQKDENNGGNDDGDDEEMDDGGEDGSAVKEKTS